MFKTEFNSLYVAARDFILGEKELPSFSDPDEQIKYYKSIVDECNILLFNLVNIQQQLPSTSELVGEINELLLEINGVFDRYKTNSVIVRSYVYELSTLSKRVTFFEKLYRFEQLFVSIPLIKVDVEEIQNVLSVAREFVADSPSFYYYANNPYEINADLGIIVPYKHSFDTAEKMLTSVYNYMYELYMRHYTANRTELDSISVLETNLANKIYELRALVAGAKERKIIVTVETTSTDFYNHVSDLENMFAEQTSDLVSGGVYRFTGLTNEFNDVYREIASFITSYKENTLYVLFIKNTEFDEKIETLAERIRLLEDGKIKADTSYIITDSSLKELVEEIMGLVKVVKRTITYTQKYHSSGNPKTLIFEFYQTGLFLESIKSYYYQLMSENIYRYSNVGIDDFGDSSIDSIREAFKTRTTNYNSFISKDISYLNAFELLEYQNTIISLQTKLKAVAVNFYSDALKTAHATYTPIIEKHYATFLNQLNEDLDAVRIKNTTAYLVPVDSEKQEASVRVEMVSTHVGNIENILDISSKYVFLGFTDYINSSLYVDFKQLFNSLQSVFNKGDYVAVFNQYDTFYDANNVNFNILYSFEQFSKKVDYLFSQVEAADAMYVDEYTGIYSQTSYNGVFTLLTDLFDDETYKVTRNELFSDIDILYEFVISTRPNEKTFLTNEKNLKKLYLDNQFMKINFIAWYHRIHEVSKRYDLLNKTKLSSSPVFVAQKAIIDKFTYKAKLISMINNQNRAVADISKMINEYTTDTNFRTVNLSPDIIRNIEVFNLEISDKFVGYITAVEILETLTDVIDIDIHRAKLKQQHAEQWVKIIEDNFINEPEKVSYNDMDPFKGTIPYTVHLKAKMETNVDVTGKEIKATYNWYIGGSIITGNEITHTFYDEGKHKVRCDISYLGGESMSRFLEFDLSGPTNTQTIKTETVSYNPTETYKDVPKLTYADPATGVFVTMPVKFAGNATAAIADGGTIDFSPNGILSITRAGLVILGFDGTGVPGSKHDIQQVFSEDFKYPEASAAEFLFDFVASAPLGSRTTIDISTSKFIKFMAKVPPGVDSVYSINKGSSYESIGTFAKVAVGDKLILKNSFDRWAVVEVTELTTTELPEDKSPTKKGQFNYTIKFRYFVNTSLENSERDAFRPTETNMIAPTLVFKASVREIFNSLVARLEEINALRDKLKTKIDNETKESINAKIADLEAANKAFYLFEELDKIKSKKYSLEMLMLDINDSIEIDYADVDNLDGMVQKYRTHVYNTKSFVESTNSVNAYDFKKNVIDLEILTSLYNDQQTLLETIIDTYNYKVYDVSFYENKIKEIKLFDTTGFIDTTLAYGPMLVELVKKLRGLLFKIKAIINYPIMSEGTHMVMSEIYSRLGCDISTGLWRKVDENDFYLLYKKLELAYGYEIEKVEAGRPYQHFISDLIGIEKELFGTGLATADIKNISNYIESVEAATIMEYDDFFLIPFWVDYLEKNV